MTLPGMSSFTTTTQSMRSIHFITPERLTSSCFSDILSFYKEELEDDTSSYIHARARTTNTSPYEILQEVIDEVVAAVERIRRLLGEGPARDAWDSFESGYIQFHLEAPRYRLGDILGF